MPFAILRTRESCVELVMSFEQPDLAFKKDANIRVTDFSVSLMKKFELPQNDDSKIDLKWSGEEHNIL